MTGKLMRLRAEFNALKRREENAVSANEELSERLAAQKFANAELLQQEKDVSPFALTVPGEVPSKRKRLWFRARTRTSSYVLTYEAGKTSSARESAKHVILCTAGADASQRESRSSAEVKTK